jgi:dimeric dUTPase (all-alpha-NTP-PPase superfamily)
MPGKDMPVNGLTVQQMFEAVAKYQFFVHNINYVTLTMTQRMQLMRDYVLAMNVEQVELLQELPWKPWNYAEGTALSLDMKKITTEWIDGLFFLLDQALVLGITADDITETFQNVLDKNYARKTGDKHYDHKCCKTIIPGFV